MPRKPKIDTPNNPLPSGESINLGNKIIYATQIPSYGAEQIRIFDKSDNLSHLPLYYLKLEVRQVQQCVRTLFNCNGG